MDDSPLQTSASVTKAKPEKEKDRRERERLERERMEKDRRRDPEKEKELEKEREREREREKAKEQDGYSLLVEKMEQVRSQMIKMERKYDELYKTFKEKDHSKSGSVTPDPSTPKEMKSPKESITDANIYKDSIESTTPKVAAPPVEEKSAGKQEMDIEKLEDNPFL